MPKTLSACLSNRDNNFNLLRFIAATLVLYSHCYPLSGIPGEPLGQAIRISFGNVAVDIFFVTSGLLVTKSLFDRKDIVFFIWSRVLRIFPALIVAVLFCVLVVGTYFTSLPLDDYFGHLETTKFIKRNITLYNGVFVHLPGVFKHLPYTAVNGSLWTLPAEIKMYSIIAIIGFFIYIKPAIVTEKTAKSIFIAVFLMSLVSFYYQFAFKFPKVLYYQHITRFLTVFFSGAVLYIFAEQVVLSFRMFLLALGALVYFKSMHTQFFIVYFLVIGYLTIYLAYIPGGVIRQFNLFGDYSYGIYIYAFPVQQSIAALIKGVDVWTMFAIAFVVTFLLAFISWHCIEKPMLRKKHVLPDLMTRLQMKKLAE
ncbi:MAG: acyltransferase [Gammaproteobacteria bacterium]|nr:acyltransferase [Gammaproteobacteria bacterium]